MSGMYKEQGSERITNKEILIIRKELETIIGKENIIDTNLIDQHGNKNLLLPNFMEEKKDNGDIDIFLYYDEDFDFKHNTVVMDFNGDEYNSPLNYIRNIEVSGNIIEINHNDHTWSMLYSSPYLQKKVQIDLHIIKRNKINCDSYFNYFRIPYFFYVIGMIQKNLGFKLGQNGFFIRMEEDIIELLNSEISQINPNIKEEFLEFNTYEYYINIESVNYLDFLDKYLNVYKSDIMNISSYRNIADVINNSLIVDYEWNTNIKAKYLKRIESNEKLQKIIPYIEIGNKDMSILKNNIRTNFILEYKDELIPKIIEEIERRKEIKKYNEIKNNLFKFFFKINELKELKNIDKNSITLISNNIDYFIEIQNLFIENNVNDFILKDNSITLFNSKEIQNLIVNNSNVVNDGVNNILTINNRYSFYINI